MKKTPNIDTLQQNCVFELLRVVLTWNYATSNKCFLLLHSTINEILDFVNSHEPMLGRVGFLQRFELKVFMTNF